MKCSKKKIEQNMIKSVSQMLLRPTEKLVIKLSVGLLDGIGKESFYSLYSAELYDYLTFNTSANVLIQYKTNEPYDRNQYIHINDMNIFHWNKELERFYQKLQRPDLFIYYKSGIIELNAKETDKQSISLRGGEFVELEPAVVFDKNGTPLPGINMRINIKDHVVDLSIDEFEAIYYKFRNLDIGAAGMRLVLARLIVDEKMKIQVNNTLPNLKDTTVEVGQPVKIEHGKSLFDGKEGVVDKRPPVVTNQPITSLDQL